MFKYCLAYYFMGFLLHPGQAFAWDGHYMLSYAALQRWPELKNKPDIQAESLKDFVESEKGALIKILKDYEIWASKNIQAYPPLPAKLAFNGKKSLDGSFTKKFLMSLRINPELNYPNFVLYAPGMPHRLKNQFSSEEKKLAPLSSISNLSADEDILEKIGDGDKVSAIEILATASEEPDHGMDLGLWQDNETNYGRVMGLGLQPFGNPVVSFSSQAPFHMGFYYEKPLLYWVAGWLKRSYPEYRISLFLTLARHAFSTGHSYWGYRFLGWALHYIQDLTQPYHATLAPGWSWLKLIALNSLEIAGIKRPAQNLRQLLTNRHLVLENYQLESIKKINTNELLALALAGFNNDKKYPQWDNNYPRKVIANEAHRRADFLDSLIVKAIPSAYVNEPAHIFTGVNPKINMRNIAFGHDPLAAQKLEFEFLNLMRAYGSHTRNAVRYLLLKP